MPYDATQLHDWQIAEAAEARMSTPEEWRGGLGLQSGEVAPMGKVCKFDLLKVIERLRERPDGKYLEITAITPTPVGEGKSTTAPGRMQVWGGGARIWAAVCASFRAVPP